MMDTFQKINNLKEAESFIDLFRHEHKRVWSNYFLTSEEFGKYIEEVDVYVQKQEDVLFFFVEETHFIRVLYFVASESYIALPQREKPYLCEVYNKEKDLAEDEITLCDMGFSKKATYRRMLLKKDIFENIADSDMIRKVENSDLVYVTEAFDVFFDDIPDCDWRKEEFLKDNYILSEAESGALLVYTQAGRVSTLKYLYVPEKYRGKGIARKLIEKYLAIMCGHIKKFVLWVKEDNVPAKNLYMSYNYSEDTITKKVYIKK